jgi:hypothetical protein
MGYCWMAGGVIWHCREQRRNRFSRGGEPYGDNLKGDYFRDARLADQTPRLVFLVPTSGLMK